jgi:hypothetical protein
LYETVAFAVPENFMLVEEPEHITLGLGAKILTPAVGFVLTVTLTGAEAEEEQVPFVTITEYEPEEVTVEF